MKRLGMIILAAALTVGGATAGASAGEFDWQIKVRQGMMTLRAWNISTLGAMAKGKMEYDAGAAQTAADNLVSLSLMSSSAMWPKGSDSTALPGKTAAKIESWTTYPAVADVDKAHIAAAARMAEVAGNGLEAVQAEIGNLGGSCGGCHKKFREKQE